MPKRINKCIELLESGQPFYATHPTELTYEAGLKDSQTWADMLMMDFEHHPFDTVGLTNYMRGLKDGGPTVTQVTGHAKFIGIDDFVPQFVELVNHIVTNNS